MQTKSYRIRIEYMVTVVDDVEARQMARVLSTNLCDHHLATVECHEVFTDQQPRKVTGIVKGEAV